MRVRTANADMCTHGTRSVTRIAVLPIPISNPDSQSAGGLQPHHITDIAHVNTRPCVTRARSEARRGAVKRGQHSREREGKRKGGTWSGKDQRKGGGGKGREGGPEEAGTSELGDKFLGTLKGTEGVMTCFQTYSPLPSQVRMDARLFSRCAFTASRIFCVVGQIGCVSRQGMRREHIL